MRRDTSWLSSDPHSSKGMSMMWPRKAVMASVSSDEQTISSLVADMQAAVLRGDGDMVVGVGDPRNDERAVDKLLHLAHRPAVEHGVGELDRYFVGVFLVFVAHRASASSSFSKRMRSA